MRPKTDQTRQRILDAAYESFWRSGFTRTNVDSRRYIDAAARAPRGSSSSRNSVH